MENQIQENKDILEKETENYMTNNCVFSCIGKECPKWVVLNQNLTDGKSVEVGRCSDAWMAILMVELRQSIDNVDKKLTSIMDKTLNIR